MTSTHALPIETVAHIQSAGCKAQKKSVIRAHNRCWGYLRGANSTHVEAKRRERECCLLVLNLVSSNFHVFASRGRDSNLEFIGGDQDRQLKHLCEETGTGDILPWEDVEDEEEKFLESARSNRQASEDSQSVRSRKMTEQ
jgi:hypothetical protein